MKYLHHFHAGNFADLVKHLVWVWILEYLQSNPNPLDIVDTHGGFGWYHQEELSAEFAYGSGSVLKATQLQHDFLRKYQLLVQNLLEKDSLFAGSPLLAAQHKRAEDKLWLFEKNTEPFERLKTLKNPEQKIYVQQRDGFAALKELLHLPLKRLAILIDPVYERPEEYAAIENMLCTIQQKRPQACVVLWYPIGKRSALMEPIFKMYPKGTSRSLRIEYEVPALAEQGLLSQCGLFIINPPYLLEQWTQDIAADLARLPVQILLKSF